jgi:hypothetical protein
MARKWSETKRRRPRVPATKTARLAERLGSEVRRQLVDDAGVPALIDAIRHMHGLESTWLESVPVVERHEGQVVSVQFSS